MELFATCARVLGECVRKREGRVRGSLWYECNLSFHLREVLNIDCRGFGSLSRLRLGLNSNNELHELGSSRTVSHGGPSVTKHYYTFSTHER